MRFTAGRAWRSTGSVTAGLLLASCSLLVGELPEPVSNGGPVAGAAGVAETMGGNSAHAGEASVGGDLGVIAPGGEGGGAGSPASCDADHDEHLAEGECGGGDCDDNDANVSPGQGDYFDEPQPRVDFDYDCSGAPEREQTEPIVCMGLALVDCPTDQTGFLGTLPACGEVGNWGKCVQGSALEPCIEDVVTTPRMRCR